MRGLVKDAYLEVVDLGYPMFVEGDIKKEIPSMPGIYRRSVDRLKEELDKVWKLGIKPLLIFGKILFSFLRFF